MKIIKRRYFEDNGLFTKSKEGLFMNTGLWADGHFAYSRVDENGQIIEEGEYYQLKGSLNINGKIVHCLYMQHV